MINFTTVMIWSVPDKSKPIRSLIWGI